MNATLIRKELLKHGASRKQADFYIGLIKDFAAQSEGSGEKHHILPVNCGWWRKYKTAQWNLAAIDWGLHAALHGYLLHIFRQNGSLGDAIRAVFMRRRGSHKRDRQNKQRLIAWRREGRSAEWISNQRLFGNPSEHSIRAWLKEWDPHYKRAHPKKEVYRHRIVNWYRRGYPSDWIANQVGVGSNTIRKWLVLWGLELRGRSETRRTWNALKRPDHIRRSALSLYKQRHSLESIGRKLQIDPKTARGIIVENGGVIDPRRRGRWIPRNPERIIRRYLAGALYSQLAREEGISTNTIRLFLKRSAIRIRSKSEVAKMVWQRKRRTKNAS